MSRRRVGVAVALMSGALVLSALAAERKVRVPRDDPRFSGGMATTAAVNDQAYRQPVEFLNAQQAADFKRGETLFDDLETVLGARDAQDLKRRLNSGDRGGAPPLNRIISPAVTGRGRGAVPRAVAQASKIDQPLGPLFNAHNCQNCHPLNGRGSQSVGYYHGGNNMPLHVSAPGEDVHGKPLPHPVYGLQIQTGNTLGVPEVASVTAKTRDITGRYEDGDEYKLVAFDWEMVDPQHGPVDDMLISPRFSPPVFGLGLIEAVADESILKMADEDDKDGDGISGKANAVYDEIAKRHGVGRFGWKAQNPTLKQQIAASARFDHSLSTTIYAVDDLTDHQRKLFRFYEREPRELPNAELADLELYLRSVGVPVRRDLKDPQVIQGDELFAKLDCAKCHVPKLITGSHDLSFLAGQTIHPYSDLLLHDMGHELSDNRPVYKAEGSEWRTPPLWGIGLAEVVGGRVGYLHDGRARTLEEAILWHGGEAEDSREEFKKLSKEERDAVLAFLKSL